LVRYLSLLENSQQLEHGLVVEGNVVVTTVGGDVLLATTAVGFESVLELFQFNVATDILVQNEN
jgi:hypothetical protein